MSASTTSMIEKVARAIADQTGMGHRWTEHRHEARAAIKAMREPTEAMVFASAKLSQPVHRSDAYLIWQAMIDAALNEGEK